jgi:hypothetical protein
MNTPIITNKQFPLSLNKTSCTFRSKSVLGIVPGALLITLLAGCSADPGNTGSISLEVISSPPHLVTGGSALLTMRYTNARDVPQLVVNGTQLQWSASIREDGEDRIATVLVNGLRNGENRIEARLANSSTGLSLTNYPISGPVFSGEHQQPYLCLQELAPMGNGNARRFAIGNGEFLDTSVQDADCALPTRVDYVYRNTNDERFLPLTDISRIPPDASTIQVATGEQIPYVVRLETGTINRAIYQIAILHDPRLQAPAADSPSPGWNGRLVYTFGGGCEAGYFQGASTGGVLRESMLASGYAVASSTLNVNAQGGCNDVLSAETTMMVKEHFTKHYGKPVHTIGTGGSGGAMQQLLIAGAYPGILDGLLPSMTFPDAVSYFTDSQECSGPWRRFANDPARSLEEDTRTLIGGWPNWYLCNESLGDRPDRISPFDCSAEIPAEFHYHPQRNPTGIRCSIYDGMRNVFGESMHPAITDARAMARSPHDNVGVQYGLQALNEGLIDKSLFLDINEHFGGWDIDYQPTATRTVGDPEAIRIAYETGRVISGDAGLARVPIIDDRVYLDDEGNFHASIYSFVTRARLERDNGHAGNYVIRRHDRNMSLLDENLALMDLWLDNIKASPDDGQPLLERITAARPAELMDDCFTATGERIVEPARFNTGRLFDNTEGQCNQLYPPHAGLRLIAGGPLSNDILKCALKPVDYGDYRVEFSSEEKARLEAIFPEGVCDWSRPGQHQTTNQTWLSFGPSPVNLYQP